MADTIFRQCKLVRGDFETFGYIPSRFAEQGKYLRIGSVNGWRVDEVWGSATRELLDLERDARLQRRSTIDG